MEIPPAAVQAFHSLGEGSAPAGFAFCITDEHGDVSELVSGSVDRESSRPWATDTLVPIWSTTKGPATATLLWLLENNGLHLQSRVRKIWPSLQADCTFGELLSHQAGLPAIDVDADALDHQAVVAQLERQPPLWPPGTRHGYHPRTFGYLLDECALRLSEKRLGEIWREQFARPHGLDVWIGLPESETGRLAKVYAGKPSVRPEEKEFIAAYMQSGSPTRRAFDGLKGLNATFEFNYPAARRCASPAFGGFASARGLAKFYALLAGGGGGIFSPQVIQWMSQPLAEGFDEILRTTTRFTAGMQMDPSDGSRCIFGHGLGHFGHPGAGGSLAFAMPERGLGVSLVLNHLEPGIFPNASIRKLMLAL